METLELTLRNNAPAVPICMMLFFSNFFEASSRRLEAA
jgi:hypothetical protein